MTDFTDIEYAVSDHIATITLTGPDKMNAGTPAMVADLIAAIDLVDADDDVRAVIITGAGKAFCAGADLSMGAKTFDYDSHADPEAGFGAERPSDAAPPRDGAGLVTLRLFDCKKPIITALNGAAVGMGATMTLPTDVRIASTTARVGFVFAQRGIVPEGASTWFLPRLVGLSQAAEWFYSGRVFDAAEALAGGLVRSVHEPDDLMPAARELAAEFAAAAPISVALTRRMMWRMLGADHPMDAHRADSRGVHATGALPDAMEGVMSFLEKRPAEFRGSVSSEFPDVFPDWEDPQYS